MKRLKKFIKKIRVFKRIRDLTDKYYEKEILVADILHDLKTCKKTVKKVVSDNVLLKAQLEKLKDKHEKATKRIATMVVKRNEFLSRAQGKIPDDVLSGGLISYKLWLMEAFMENDYIPYKPHNDRETFVDGPSAAKGFIGVTDEVAKKEKTD